MKMMMMMIMMMVMQVFTEFDDDNGQRSPRFSTSSHEVLGVVDSHSRRLLSFSDAARRGLIDPATDVYHDFVKRRLVYPTDAMRQGLIKTKLLSQSDGGCAAWLLHTASPVIPAGELALVAVVRSEDSASPGKLSVWPAATGEHPPSDHLRTTISGWLLDL